MALGKESEQALKWLCDQPEQKMPCTRFDFQRHYGDKIGLLHSDAIIDFLLSEKHIVVTKDYPSSDDDRISLTQSGREYVGRKRKERIERIFWSAIVVILVTLITNFLMNTLGW